MQVKANACPNCKAVLDAVAPVDKQEVLPRKGDLTVCLYCAAILVFEADGTVRLPTKKEIEEALQMPEIKRARELSKRWKSREN